jgi:hypothetical protein
MKPFDHGVQRLVGVAVCLALGSWGCSGTKSQESLRLVPSPRVYEGDIPFPVGFRFLEKVSEDRSTGTARLYLRHSYDGHAPAYVVRNFYREQMPLAGWAMVSDGNVKGDYTLRFEKASEACTVHIHEKAGLSTVTEVEVVISQEQKGKAPPGTRSQQ